MDDLKRMIDLEVTICPEDGKSMFADDAFPATDNLDAFVAPKAKAIEAARKLAGRGFIIHDIGDYSISASCPAGQFEEFFRTKISEQKLDAGKLEVPEGYAYKAPIKGAPFEVPSDDGFNQLIERAYIQQEPIMFANEQIFPMHHASVITGNERELPPQVAYSKWRLRVPGDVAELMRASDVHQHDGLTGKGITVAMPDTGFYHHPYFQAQGYNFLSVAAPDTNDHTRDAHGHGTGECANLFATAPGINFIGVKMRNPTLALKTAIALGPDIMTNSWGYHADRPGTQMPNFLKPLYLTILSAVRRGITVCFSAGNGHLAFPASMPEVISVGGVYVDEQLSYRASNYASGFESSWFPGRSVPDICGLVGERPRADYIVLPVEDPSQLNTLGGGWGAFSGTSAASPMVAGVCALLKEAKEDLRPDQIRSLLKFTARDITQGQCAQGHAASLGPDQATGYGLVDATRAIEAVI